MNLHEYQAKEVFSAYGIPVPAGRVASTPDEAVAAAEALGGSIWVVKAQVHAGGRGKAGGVKLAKDTASVRAAAAAMLGTRLATKQTGPEGLPVTLQGEPVAAPTELRRGDVIRLGDAEFQFRSPS